MSKFECPENSPRNNFKFAIDWYEFMITILPIFRRKPKIISWLGIVFNEFQMLYDSFLIVRCNTLLATAVNGQTIVFEEGLNQMFDPIDKGIVIINKAGLIDTLTVYNEDEPIPVGENIFIYNEDEGVSPAKQVYVFNENEVELTEDFIIEVPVGLFVTIPELEAYIELYRPVGTVYKIVFI